MKSEQSSTKAFYLKALQALERSAISARQLALAHNTDIVVWQNNTLKRLTPQEIREEAANYERNAPESKQ